MKVTVLLSVCMCNQYHSDAMTCCKLVRCLVPSREVPHSVVLRALCSMGPLPVSLRLVLFKWIVLVYDVIDNTAPLRKVYDVIIHYIQYDGLRQIVCQLLCYITTRDDGEREFGGFMVTFQFIALPSPTH